jgi:NDP-sugar pyrophosphorylase family protein
MKVLIPMAGEGSRFAKQGYQFPKPLIDVNGKPMIQRVVENLNYDAKYIFLIRSEHLKKYEGLRNVINQIAGSDAEIATVDSLTEGAACTALLAKDLINDKDDLLIANSDQIVEYESQNFEFFRNHGKIDGSIFTFNAVHPKWSFVRVNHDGCIVEVAEKNPISNIATCGIYWFKHGSDFVSSTERMISKNIRVNNEFYIAPVFNEMIQDGKRLFPFYVHRMWGIGTPEDLNLYLESRHDR